MQIKARYTLTGKYCSDSFTKAYFAYSPTGDTNTSWVCRLNLYHITGLSHLARCARGLKNIVVVGWLVGGSYICSIEYVYAFAHVCLCCVYVGRIVSRLSGTFLLLFYAIIRLWEYVFKCGK